jgi:predicted DNA-binding protein
MKLNATPKRFLSVRLSPEELEEVYQYSKSTNCRSLTEYVKKVLTKKPVTFKVRNESYDQLLATMAEVKSRLDRLAEQAEDAGAGTVLREIAELKTYYRESLDRWSA